MVDARPFLCLAVGKCASRSDPDLPSSAGNLKGGIGMADRIRQGTALSKV